MNIAEWLKRKAMVAGNSPALFSGVEQLADYSAFAQSAAKLGGVLQEQYDIRPGDRVALYMYNSPDYLIALFGILWCGATAVPINAKLHPREAGWIVENSGAKAVFLDADTEAEAGEVLGADVRPILPASAACQDAQRRAVPLEIIEREDHDLAWLFYTSGTTGRPKGVMLCHGNLAAMSLCYLADVDQVFASDSYIYAAPMSHGAGLYTFVNVLMGSRHVVPASGKFEADEFLALAKMLGNGTAFLAPTMIRKLADEQKQIKYDGKNGIRTIVYGGAPMYAADMLEYLSLFGDVFVQIYGQGECPMTITSLPRRDHTPENAAKLSSVGFPMSAVEVRAATEAGVSVERGEIGEVEVRGAPVMLGYWAAPEATAASLKDGWLRTGDVGWFDDAGYLHLSDRSKDVIISGGSNIYPREVEEVLAAHPGVQEVSVIGLPDKLWGEVVAACVVLREGATVPQEELDELCLNAIARFKRPKTYFFLRELPKNNYGKILKTELRTYAAQAQSG